MNLFRCARSLVALLAISLFLTTINSWGQVPTASDRVITIYPLGDSITAGYGPPSQGGYRVPLYQKLRDAGMKVQFVGTSARNSGDDILADANQTHHEGHGGYRIDQLLHNLDGVDQGDSTFGGYWMTGGHGTGREPLHPDIILIHGGTNDILQKTPIEMVEKRLQDLLDWFAAHSPQSKVFVAKILPTGDRDNADGEVQALNSWLEGKLTAPPYVDHGFFLVDMHKPFIDSAGKISHLPDGIHPDKDGYEIMAKIWFQAMSDAKVLSP